MIQYITIIILALLVPVIMQAHGIDHPVKIYKRSYVEVDNKPVNFVLPRGQPVVRASIIKQKTFPRNKGKPNTS
jgi:hypothetical protein